MKRVSLIWGGLKVRELAGKDASPRAIAAALKEMEFPSQDHRDSAHFALGTYARDPNIASYKPALIAQDVNLAALLLECRPLVAAATEDAALRASKDPDVVQALAAWNALLCRIDAAL